MMMLERVIRTAADSGAVFLTMEEAGAGVSAACGTGCMDRGVTCGQQVSKLP